MKKSGGGSIGRRAMDGDAKLSAYIPRTGRLLLRARTRRKRLEHWY